MISFSYIVDLMDFDSDFDSSKTNVGSFLTRVTRLRWVLMMFLLKGIIAAQLAVVLSS